MIFAAPEFEVSEDIAKARTLPPEAFRDLKIARAEERQIHQKGFQLLPPNASPSECEASHPTSLASIPLVITRDAEATLSAVSNVCTHAWYPVSTEAQKGRFLTCGQHGRRFDLKGRALTQMGFDASCGFPCDEDHLAAYPMKQVGPLSFVGLGQESDEAWTHFGHPWVNELANYPLDQLKYASRPDERRTLEGNWKQHAWNYLDSFHIPFIHRGPAGLIDAIDYKSYTTETYESAVLQWAWAKNPEHGLKPEHTPERLRHPDKRVFALWWFIWPNLTLNFYPWGLSVNRYGISSENPSQCQFEWYHYVLDDELYAQADKIWLNDQVDQEDVDAMSLVRANIESGNAKRARFSPSEEKGPHWFHHLVSKSILATN